MGTWCKVFNVCRWMRGGVTKIEQVQARAEERIQILVILRERNNWMPLALFPCCFILHFFRVELVSCCTFVILHLFYVALFPFCTFFVLALYMFHFFVLFRVALLSRCAFSVLNFKVELLSSYTIFVFSFFHNAMFSSWTFFLANSFMLHLFSRCTLFTLHHFFLFWTFFILHLFLWCTLFMLYLFFILDFFHVPPSSFCISSLVEFFPCCTFFSLEFHFWPISCVPVSWCPFSLLRFHTLHYFLL